MHYRYEPCGERGAAWWYPLAGNPGPLWLEEAHTSLLPPRPTS